MLIDLFINAGWYTVPLSGELKRLEGGKKTLPIFEKDWRKKYTAEFNTKRTKLAGSITGACSGIVAVDCDNQMTYDLFMSLDPDANFIFKSEGKPEGGATLIYKYNDVVGTFKLNTDEFALDYFSDEGFIYLPTEDNKTKESWEGVTKLPELREMPPQTLAMLKAFKAKVPKHEVKKSNEMKHTISNRLAPMVDNFIKGKKYDPILFKILTPYSFRDIPSYVTKGHLHPNDVPHGRGSEYLTKISAILGADISINIETYTNCIMLINSFWDEPMQKDKLYSTIINPMIEGRAQVDGHVIWQYDPHWEQMGLIATAINGDYLESFYDDVKGVYYLINYTVPWVKTYTDKRPVITTLKTLLGRPLTEGQYDSTKQLIRTTLNPSQDFGHVEGTDNFNLFRQTPELAVLTNPQPYASEYNRPNTILNYFETLIPDEDMRRYILSFFRTKLTTFKYSPVILYFIGKPGSGKDTLVNILRQIINPEYVAKPDTKVFLEQYNGWLMDKFIIQLDEYGNKLTRASERQEALGKIKAYTGSEEVQIRAMRQDGFNYKHGITFIMTANSNPLPLETDDRRVCFVKTPNPMKTQKWVAEAGGISHVQDLIKAEVMDFCYYLATEVENLKLDDYVSPPYTEDKEKLILDNLPAADQIVFYLQRGRYAELIDLAVEHGVCDFDDNWENDRLEDAKLAELYDAMTEGNGSHRYIIKMLKSIGISRSHTTRNGANSFYYMIAGLNKHKATNKDGFQAIEGVEKVQPKGLE